MTTDPIEPPPEYESDDVNKPSRFSDDEVETEIEVETQENDNEAQKKKKRRKKRSQKTKQDATNENGIVEEKNLEKADLRKTLSNPSEDSESLSDESLSKRKSLKQKFYRFRAAPFLFLIGCKICVLLPIAIYACDVIIAMNTPEYNALDLFHHPKNNATSLELPPNPYKTADFPYDKTIMKLLYRVENENRIARMQHEHNIRYRTAVVVTAANATGNETVPTLQRDIMTTEGTPVTVTATASGVLVSSSTFSITSSVAATVPTPESTTSSTNSTTSSTTSTTSSTTSATSSTAAPTSGSTDDTTTQMLQVNYTSKASTVTSISNLTATATEATVTATATATEATVTATATATTESGTTQTTEVSNQFSTRESIGQNSSTTTTTGSTPTANSTASVSERNVTTTTVNQEKTTSLYTAVKQRNGYCEDVSFFYRKHQETYATEKKDWLQTRYTLLKMSQQAMFYVFVIGGFLLLMTSIVMRSEMLLNNRWSSFILIHFILYSISTCISAHMFTLLSSREGIRCFLCRCLSYCTNIDPWYLGPDGYFPNGINVTLVIFISYILKVYDSFIIAIVTLTYTIDPEEDRWWHMIWKVFGWLILFPVIIFAPLVGVIKYEVLPVTVDYEGNEAAYLAMDILFYIGVGLWGIMLIAVPIFCKLRMCNNTEEEEEEEY